MELMFTACLSVLDVIVVLEMSENEAVGQSEGSTATS